MKFYSIPIHIVCAQKVCENGFLSYQIPGSTKNCECDCLPGYSGDLCDKQGFKNYI